MRSEPGSCTHTLYTCNLDLKRCQKYKFMFKYSTGLNKGTAVRLAESIPLCRDNFKFSLKMNTMSAQPGAFQDLEEETGNHLEEML